MKSYKTVEEFLKKAPAWNAELATLREILLSTGLEETMKWGAPAYCYNGKNVVGIGGFKNYFGLWFFQGALLKDSKKHLINAQDSTTKAMRQWRFESPEAIDAKTIRSYVKEACELVDKGIAIKPDRDKPLVVPPELEAALKKNRKAKAIFDAMSKSCRREYAEHISTAKQLETKQRRLEKILPMIEAGGGLNDKYKSR